MSERQPPISSLSNDQGLPTVNDAQLSSVPLPEDMLSAPEYTAIGQAAEAILFDLKHPQTIPDVAELFRADPHHPAVQQPPPQPLQ